MNLLIPLQTVSGVSVFFPVGHRNGGCAVGARDMVRAADRGVQCGSRSTVQAELVSTRMWAKRGVSSNQKLED